MIIEIELRINFGFPPYHCTQIALDEITMTFMLLISLKIFRTNFIASCSNT